MGERTPNITPGNIGRTLETLEQIIAQRAATMPEVSYTAKLLKDPALAAAKVVEEAQELVELSGLGDAEHIRYEAGDLVYHLLVLLQINGVSLDELAGELDARKS